MRRLALALALLSTGCTTLEPAYVRPTPAIPASWPVGDAYLRQSEATLPAVTYQQIFRDARLQTLIGQALVNNQDLATAAVTARDQGTGLIRDFPGHVRVLRHGLASVTTI